MLRKYICTVVTFVWMFSAIAQAQQRYPVGYMRTETFRPALNREGILDVESANARHHLAYSVGMLTGYSSNSFVLRSTGAVGEQTNALVRHRLGGSLYATLSLKNWFEIGAELPVMLWQVGETNIQSIAPAMNISGFTREGVVGIGDLRLMSKMQFLFAKEHHIDLALITHISIATAYPQAEYLGEPHFWFSPMLALSRSYAKGFKWALNFGILLRPIYQISAFTRAQNVEGRFALGYDFDSLFNIPIEFHVSTRSGSQFYPNFAGESGGQTNGLEVNGALIFKKGRDIRFTLGGGGGVLQGLGVPDFRVIGGELYSGGPCIDSDGDGLCDEDDSCPNAAEDFDGFADHDGCPDEDNDGDGIPDTIDQCPNDPETFNDWQDEDGCPDVDPNVDSDGDGIPDTIDQCPNDPETFNDWQDEDGCPDVEKRLIIIERDLIELREEIHFPSGRTKLMWKSYPVLNQVAEVMKYHPEIAKIRIEGHSDNQGTEEFNYKLSKDRAKAVYDYLVEQGVEPTRMEFAAFGDRKPVDNNKSWYGRQKNRRVDIFIIEYNDR